MKDSRRHVVQNRTLDAKGWIARTILSALGEVEQGCESDEVILPATWRPAAFEQPVLGAGSFQIGNRDFAKLRRDRPHVGLILDQRLLPHVHVSPRDQKFPSDLCDSSQAANRVSTFQPIVDNRSE